MRILITGGTGFVGTSLIQALSKDPSHQVRALSRNPEKAASILPPSVSLFKWNPEKELPPPQALDAVDAILHLAGENIAEGRWTTERKRRIRDSRVLGTRNLVQGIETMATPPRVLVSTSAVGIYGDQKDQILTEAAPEGDGFLAEVCRNWEDEAKKARVQRLVLFRLGVVLGSEGGMLKKVLPLFRAGLGGPLGNGQQWMSWIALDDLIHLLLQALQDERFDGVFNATSPDPIRNGDFTQALARQLRRPAVLPAPAFGLKLAFGQMAEEALLASQRAVPQRLLELGHRFQSPTLDSALGKTIP